MTQIKMKYGFNCFENFFLVLTKKDIKLYYKIILSIFSVLYSSFFLINIYKNNL